MSQDPQQTPPPPYKVPTRFLGKSGLKVPVLGMGTWVNANVNQDYEKIKSVLTTSYDHGIFFFDTAEIYSNGDAEVILGRVIQEMNWDRSSLVISTKLFKGGPGPNDTGLSRKHLIEGTRKSLKRLNLEYVDLLYCHRPDFLTPMEETCRAMDFIINQGWALYWGTSEWSAQQLTEALAVCRENHLIAPIVEQPQYNMLHRERVEVEYEPLYRQDSLGLGLTIWSPLKYGLLTGKYNDGIPEGSRLQLEFFNDSRNRLETEDGLNDIRKVRELTEIAKEIGCTMAQLAIAWCVKNVNVSCTLLGASRPEQVVENVESCKFVESITPEIEARIEDILKNKKTRPVYFGR